MSVIRIENTTYFDGEKVQHGSFSIVDGKITFANHARADIVINGKGYFFMPGLVNAHHHTYSTLARGVPFNAKIRNFYENLAYFWWRWDASLDEDSIYYSALIGAMESLRKGVTTVFDHHASFSYIEGSLSLLKDAFEKIGIRALVCFEASSRLGHERAIKSIKENERFIAEDETHLVKGVVGLHANFTLSDEIITMAREVVKKYKRPVHIHVSEDRFDRDYVIARYGIPPVMRLEKNQLLENALLAHVIWVDEDEIELLKERNSYVLHNPESNMNNNVGYFNLRGMLDKKVKILLGTDGFSHSVLTQYRNGVLNATAKGINGYEVFPEILKNNYEAASGFFSAKLGRIKEGFDGDVVGFKYIPFTPLRDDNIFSHIFFDLPEKQAEFVIVNGKPVIMDGEFVNIDEEEIRAKAREVALLQWKRFLQNTLDFRLPDE